MAVNARAVNAYNAANVMLMRSESSSADTLVAMLASCAPSMQAPRSVGVGGLEEAVMGSGTKRSYYPLFDTSEETGDDDAADDCAHHVEKKRRLTVDQVRSLEKNFELENKLEPDRKMQLARELGLQPRQVAVWFQNRRARWKTKQLERDYDVLKLEYEALKVDYEAIAEKLRAVEKENLRLSGKLQTSEKQRKLDGHVFEGENIGVATDLSKHLGTDLHVSMLVQDFQLTAAATLAELPVKCKDKEGTTSSESNSSEIMNADSPHPIDSGLSPVDQKMINSQFPAVDTQTAMEPTLVQYAEEMCGRVLAPPPAYHRIAVKLEDGSFQEECNYFYSMDESGALPWWEWP